MHCTNLICFSAVFCETRKRERELWPIQNYHAIPQAILQNRMKQIRTVDDVEDDNDNDDEE